MARYLPIIAKRLLVIPVSLLVVVTLAFGLVELMPGDPAVAIAGDFASDEYLAEIRAELGLDKTRGERYVDFLRGLTEGDLGTSFRTGQPITGEIARFLPNTVELILVSLVLSLIGGVAIGTLGGYFRGRTPDKFSRSLVTIMQSVPVFVLGLGIIFVFFYVLRWLPAPVGRLGFSDVAPPRVTGFLFADLVFAGDWATLRSALLRLVMPMSTIGIIYAAYFAKIARSMMLDAMSSPEIEFARASGLRERRVVHYAMLRGRTPILTYAAILVGQLVGGATVVEYIFAWNGVGFWGLQGILSLDVPVIQAFVMIAGIITLVTYVILDIVIIALDPRISYA